MTIARRELVEGPPGNLHDAIVQGRLEGRQRLLGDSVRDLVEAFAHGDLRRYSRNWVPGGLAGQGRAAAHPGVDLDHEILVGVDRAPWQRSSNQIPWSKCKLNIAPALDLEGPDDVQARRPEHLVLLVGEGLGGRDDAAIAGMHPHRVDVLHVADGDAIVCAVPHDLVLKLFPADEGPLQKYLSDGAGSETTGDNLHELFPVVCDPPAGAAKGICGPNHQWEADHLGFCDSLGQCADRSARRHRFTYVEEELPEQVAVLGASDSLQACAQQPHIVAFEYAGIRQLDRQIKTSLAAQGREKAIWPLGLDDPLDSLDCQGLDIHDIGDPLVGHDGRRVGVDQHRRDALFAESLARLRASIVKLCGLPDYDGPRANHKDFFGLFVHSA